MKTPPKTLGLRHIALLVKEPQTSKRFYTEVMGMEVEWEPDPENIYLTSQRLDNLALHKANAPSTELPSLGLDHIGFFLQTATDVDLWYAWIKDKGAKIVREIKTHRDGARSFYFLDPDEITIQMIYHPAIIQKN